MKIDVIDQTGKKSKKQLELLDDIFSVEVNENLLYADVRRYMTNKRQGNSSTKERSQVRGGGRKAYRQKGTGMARRGSIRSPLLKGGGTVHGPRTKNYKHGLSKKMKRLARKSALSLKSESENIYVVQNLEFDTPKTNKISELLTNLELNDKKVLLLTNGTKKNVYLSARNIPKVKVLEAQNIYTYAILDADVILIEEGGVEKLQQTFQSNKEEAAA